MKRINIETLKKHINNHVLCGCKTKKTVKEKLKNNELQEYQELSTLNKLGLNNDEPIYTETNFYNEILSDENTYIFCVECDTEIKISKKVKKTKNKNLLRYEVLIYKELKGYEYITKFISCGKTFYNFHIKKDGIVNERLTFQEIKDKLKEVKK